MEAIIRRCFLMTDEQGGVTELTTNDLTLPWPISALTLINTSQILITRWTSTGISLEAQPEGGACIRKHLATSTG